MAILKTAKMSKSLSWLKLILFIQTSIQFKFWISPIEIIFNHSNRALWILILTVAQNIKNYNTILIAHHMLNGNYSEKLGCIVLIWSP